MYSSFTAWVAWAMALATEVATVYPKSPLNAWLVAHYQLKLFCTSLRNGEVCRRRYRVNPLKQIKVMIQPITNRRSMQINKTLLLANCYLTNVNMGFAFLTSFRTVASRRTGLTLFRGGAKSSSALFSSSSRTALDEVDEEGAFKRQDSAWRNWISSEKGSQFPPELDRYHLFVAYACRKYTT
jgi:hypothetical protein